MDTSLHLLTAFLIIYFLAEFVIGYEKFKKSIKQLHEEVKNYQKLSDSRWDERFKEEQKNFSLTKKLDQCETDLIKQQNEITL